MYEYDQFGCYQSDFWETIISEIWSIFLVSFKIMIYGFLNKIGDIIYGGEKNNGNNLFYLDLSKNKLK